MTDIRSEFEEKFNDLPLKADRRETAMFFSKWAIEMCIKIVEAENNPYLIDASIRQLAKDLEE